jgi:hypothetical protein
MAKMTLDKLARMMAGGFEEVNKKVDGLETGMNRRMDRLETQIKEAKGEVGNWGIEIRSHEHRIERLERKAGLT